MQHNRKIIYLVGFLFSLPVALTAYINSSFLSSFVGEKLVAIVYVLGSTSSVMVLLFAPKILKKIGGYKFLLWVVFLDILSILAITLTTSIWSAGILFILFFSLNSLIFFSLDELSKIFSKDSNTGKVRGTYLAFTSCAWIVAQLASSTILGEFSFQAIYFLAFLIMILCLLISFLKLKNIPDPQYDDSNALKSIKEFFHNKNLTRAYGFSLLLQTFFCWMIIYTPIYLSAHLGFSWKEISMIFAIMLLPFVIIPSPLGKYADKIGERKILMLGFLITSFTTISLFLIERHEIWIWALLLFATRIGAATIESMSDIYFLKHIRPENEEFLGVYRTATPVAFIIGPAVALLVLSLVPAFNYIYVVLGALMLYGVYLASKIKRGDV